MYEIRLDADLGGDIDDLYALAMLPRWSDDVELNGITTVAEANGRYVIPGGLNLIEIDVEKGEGIYVEPNVWMVHEIR
jgi:hypothetical protein